ncbi:mechanosensitive ion channel family protein [Sphingomonas sp. M1-B02]|uniref:mechanosensitive ion channel family protein n=1 Tax=Sphingomonas sp. M1-B02 TaxID=3114300 RepID=UPI0022408496|nr:mechanosensitive ion channel domain-containing protein [Sphingomonas sp. S6-11]UZK67816.1 mechanosensitive ion channel [Sphingomonas sp. S6-11]
MSGTFQDVALVWGLKIVYAGAVLGVGIWLAFFISRFAKKQTVKNPRIDSTLGTFLSRMVRYVIIIVVVIVVLQMFGVQTASLVAIVGASALAVGLALQGTLGNVASGIMVALIRPYHIGDFVEINGKEGLVTDLNLFFTELATLDDRRILVPNGQAVSNPIINFTTHGRRRCVIIFGVGYEDDLDKVIEVLHQIMTTDRRALDTPSAWFGVESLGDFSVNVSARVWVGTNNYLDYRADMIKAVKEAFDREGIEMPYPHAVEMSKGELQMRQAPIKPAIISDQSQAKVEPD